MSDKYGCKIEEIEMPKNLVGRYQKYTCSDNERLTQNANYEKSFLSLEEGMSRYLKYLEQK